MMVLSNTHHAYMNTQPNCEKILHTTASGTCIRLVNKDHLHIDFKSIKSVGLENIADVEFHSINTIVNSCSHLIKFRNGGKVTFAYNHNGQLIDLSATGVNLLLSQNDELTFSIKPINANPPLSQPS